jgi:hypothetical protein
MTLILCLMSTSSGNETCVLLPGQKDNVMEVGAQPASSISFTIAENIAAFQFKGILGQVPVAHTRNPRYLGG